MIIFLLINVNEAEVLLNICTNIFSTKSSLNKPKEYVRYKILIMIFCKIFFTCNKIPHYNYLVRKWLNDRYPGRWISRRNE